MQAEAGFLASDRRTGRAARPHGPFASSTISRASLAVAAALPRVVGARADRAGARRRCHALRRRHPSTDLPGDLVSQRRPCHRAPPAIRPSFRRALRDVSDRDGNIFVMCVLPKFWEALCAAIGLPELPVGCPFPLGYVTGSPTGMRSSRSSMRILSKRSTARLDGRPCWEGASSTRAARFAEALDNPVSRGRRRHPVHRAIRFRPDFRVLSSPIRLDGERIEARRAPALGADTDAAACDAGYERNRDRDARDNGDDRCGMKLEGVSRPRPVAVPAGSLPDTSDGGPWCGGDQGRAAGRRTGAPCRIPAGRPERLVPQHASRQEVGRPRSARILLMSQRFLELATHGRRRRGGVPTRCRRSPWRRLCGAVRHAIRGSSTHRSPPSARPARSASGPPTTSPSRRLPESLSLNLGRDGSADPSAHAGRRRHGIDDWPSPAILMALLRREKTGAWRLHRHLDASTPRCPGCPT